MGHLGLLRETFTFLVPCIAEEKWQTYIPENYVLKHTELFHHQILDCVQIYN